MRRDLIIVRGMPGSGKSEFALLLSNFNSKLVCTADDYHMVDDTYQYDETRAPMAYKLCEDKCERLMMSAKPKVYVANTNVDESKLKRYSDLAEKYDYRVYYIFVENRHGGVTSHGVSTKVYNSMYRALNVNLVTPAMKFKIKSIKPIITFLNYFKKY